MPTPFNNGPVENQQYVAYLDLSGGRNTKRDPHALDRNQLVVSDNTWIAQGNTIAKRPGNISIAISAGSFGAISAGGVGSGVGAKAMVEGRFYDVTALVVQGANSQLYGAPLAVPAISVGLVAKWVSIGAISGGTIAAAQLFDPDKTNPNGPDGSLFIVDGVDTPKYWNGPGNVLTPCVPAQLPQKTGVAAPITPKYVATLFSSLFYAGEPTDPNAVYVSNPFNPQQFTINIIAPTPSTTTNSYIPLYAGRGDGINGGYITGLAPLGQSMIIYKESSIYYMYNVSLTGQMLWATAVGSASVGMTAPKSLVPFDTFHVFLGIDGVYTFDGTNTKKISENNPDLFDGPAALIANRTTAVGVRYGDRYLIWFDSGVGYPNTGAWFDFGRLDVDGYPCCGTVSAMNVGGIAPLRGPQDTGNFAWADAVVDRVGVFNALANSYVASSDFGSAITTSVSGKADFFADVWSDEGMVDQKSIDSAQLLMSFPIVAANQSYTFNATVFYDQLTSTLSLVNSYALPTPGVALVGTAVVGTAVVSIASVAAAYQILPLYQPSPATGTILQFTWTESSVWPWTALGYTLLVNRQRRTGTASG
ncbi:MAG: hypothetical protein WAN50_03375 [Minisyncoccia bacterium]